MPPVELRNPADARRFVVQGLWLQGVQPPAAEAVRPVLERALAAAADGHALLPVGVIADLGHVALGADRAPKLATPAPGWPAALAIPRAVTLSPSWSRIFGFGPTKAMPASPQARANAAFSERNP